MFEEGEVFHPNIAYHLDSADFGRAAEMGINVVQVGFRDTATIENTLAEAEKYGFEEEKDTLAQEYEEKKNKEIYVPIRHINILQRKMR